MIRTLRHMETHPLSREHYLLIEAAIGYYRENFRAQPVVDDVAAHLRVSTSYLKRLFRRWAGIPPKQFLETLTAEYVRRRLIESRDLVGSAFEAGLSGPGRLHDHMVTVYATTPGEVKALGATLAVRYGIGATPFGEAIVFTSDRGISRLEFVDDNKAAILESFRADWPKAQVTRDDKTAKTLLSSVFDSQHSHDFRLLLRGTNFQINVWKALLNIPSGRLVSYGEVARRLKAPKSHRAVASAVARNPVAYLIPCHRVIRESGLLGGYHWGETRKQAVIGWEGARAEGTRATGSAGAG